MGSIALYLGDGFYKLGYRNDRDHCFVGLCRYFAVFLFDLP